MPEIFCSQSSINISENLFGTAPKFNRLLLIEYPNAWGVNPLTESKIDYKVKQYLSDCLEKNLFEKVLLIKNNKRSTDRINLFMVTNDEKFPSIKHLYIDNYSTLLDINFSENFGSDFRNTMYLVCTNGKKDMCCSKFGLPFYNELSKLSEYVWQCTHIGGDRFAPNVFTLPHGHFYGHFTIEEVNKFFADTNDKKIYFPKYRGRSCYKNKEQAAEYFLRKELQDYSFTNYSLLESHSISSNIISVRFFHSTTNSKYDIVIQVKKSDDKYFLTCKTHETSHVNIITLLSISRVDNDNGQKSSR